MTSVAKVRLVYCPKCQHLLPEIAQFPVYQCGNCKAILQAKHAKAKLQVEHKRADLSSSCNGATSNGDLNPGNSPDPKHHDDGVRPKEVCRDKLESTGRSASSLPVDELGCNMVSEFPHGKKDSEGNFDSKDFNSRMSSTSSRPKNKSQKVKEAVHENKTLHFPLGNVCDDTMSSNGQKEYKEGYSKKLSHTSNFNNVVIEDAASDRQMDCRKKEAADVTAKCPIYNGCCSSSPDIDTDNLIPEQRLRLSRRTLFKQQEDELTDWLTESMEKNLQSSPTETRAMEAPSCSSKLMSKGEMTNPPQVSQGSGSPSKTAMHVPQFQIKGHEELYPPTLIQENFEDYHSQTALQRNMNSRFLLQEPTYFLGPCTMDEVPYNCVETIHSGLDYSHNDPLVLDRIECLEHEKFELLRKVDELREYISRSHLATGRSNGRAPTAGLQFYETDSSLDPTWNALGKQSRSIPYFHHNEAKIQDLPHYHKNFILEEECLETCRQSPGSHHQSKGMPESCRFSQSPILGQPRNCGCEFCFSAAHTIETDRETVRSKYADNNSISMFSSCAHCLRNYERPSQLTSCICSNQDLCRSCAGPFHYHDNSPTYALRQTHMDASVSSSFQDSKKKVLMEPEHDMYLKESCHQDDDIRMTKKTACRPIFGGAPFLTCYGCSKLLKLPDLLHSKKRVNKVKCGNCSLILNFAGSDKRRVTYARRDGRFSPAEMDEKGENASSKRCTTCDRQEATGEFADSRPTNGDDFQSGPVSCSEECGTSIPRSHFSSDIDPTSITIPFPAVPDHVLEKEGGLTNSSKWIRKGMKLTSKDLMNKQKNRRNANESNNISEAIEESFRAAAGAPLHAHFGYLSASDLLKRDRSIRKESEIGIAYSPVFGTNHLDKHLFLHEMKLEPWASPGLPDKVDREKRSSKDSMIPGFIKKGIRDLSLGLEGVKSKVFVNGRPIPDRLVKKAEEQAGPIQPGHYWYDCEAGFWGVMGHPCLGIIPPHIEEFNYPVPRNCTGGKTGVIVNGRELHQKDLEMLAGKGLPVAANKEYIVNISGQVIDKASGERFNLVELAPTIVKAGRGFGMRGPNSIQ